MAPRINLPPLTRGLIISLVVLSLANAAARYRSWEVDRTAVLGSRQYYAPYITIVPSLSIVYPWVFVTATFAEQNIFGLLITAVTLFYGGRYLERAWSSSEYIKFLALVAIVPNIASFLLYLSLFVLTRNMGLASTSIGGGIAIQAAFLVSFKQLVPEHTVSLLRNLVRIRVKHFPAIFLLANTISGLAFGTDTAMILAWLGFLTSWLYLRFFRISPSLATGSTGEGAIMRGDASDTFAFAYFWPDLAHSSIALVCDFIYDTMIALRICTPFSSEDVEMSNVHANARGEAGLPHLLNSQSNRGRPGGRREEAERRRALALRALDQRLQTPNIRQPPAIHTIPAPQLGETPYEPEPSGLKREVTEDGKE